MLTYENNTTYKIIRRRTCYLCTGVIYWRNDSRECVRAYVSVHVKQRRREGRVTEKIRIVARGHGENRIARRGFNPRLCFDAAGIRLIEVNAARR